MCLRPVAFEGTALEGKRPTIRQNTAATARATLLRGQKRTSWVKNPTGLAKSRGILSRGVSPFVSYLRVASRARMKGVWKSGDALKRGRRRKQGARDEGADTRQARRARLATSKGKVTATGYFHTIDIFMRPVAKCGRTGQQPARHIAQAPTPKTPGFLRACWIISNRWVRSQPE